MTEMTTVDTLHGEALARAADQAVRAIPPAWPLTATVAVNPFLGQITETLDQTAARLARIGGVRLALPRKHYADQIAKGEITDQDLVAALQSSALFNRIDLPALKAAVAEEPQPLAALPTIAELAARATGKDWPGLVSERIGTFAAGFFDQGQALWAASRRNGLYAAWRAFATHDLTPEILGLKGFSIHVDETPETPEGAIERVAVSLGLGAEPGTYFHQLLLTVGGWAQYARHIQFKAEVEGRTDKTALELLAIQLVFEEALYARHKTAIESEWQQVRRKHAEPVSPDFETVIDGVLQVAAERAAQRKLAATLATPIDRSRLPSCGQSCRRPSVSTCARKSSAARSKALILAVRTLGFAGFFGLGASHRGFASDVAEHRLPVLLKALRLQLQRCGSRRGYRSAGAVQRPCHPCLGPFQVGGRLLLCLCRGDGPCLCRQADARRSRVSARARARMRQSRALRRASIWIPACRGRRNGAEGHVADGRVRPLRADFAGHGANVVNNPYASALHCGACGGYAGDVNARLLGRSAERPCRAGESWRCKRDQRFRPTRSSSVDCMIRRRIAVTLFEDDLENDLTAGGPRLYPAVACTGRPPDEGRAGEATTSGDRQRA